MSKTIKLKFITACAGLDFSYGFNEVAEVNEELAKQLITSRIAEPVQEEIETAEAKPKAEKAIKRK